ncbi:hypothetical protein [Streptomyces sp. TS71-3]|uniref:hypothetical protein n=1 Tax=Streptomyces sp. TS71-3 TaxID=2733862 RepID=UPI001B0B1C75|nr:hypothetical protein [Streptomyces sp. TS71-3]GHJ41668.1 hypothetical protein Sm713_72770 [Streptomyces sp. TS71-3]
MTPLAAVGAGALAGAVGTAAMDTVRYLRDRRAGTADSPLEWEFPPVEGWKDAPDPGQVAKRVVEGFTQRPIPDRWAWLTSNAAHWSYGAAMGALYGVVAGSLRDPRPVYGLPFGAGVWGSGYLFLALGGFYEPIWRYDAKTLAKDLSAHLAYGAGTGVVFWLVDRVGVLSHRPGCS